MAILSLDQIKESVDLPTEVVSVPEWGGDVIVQGASLNDGMDLLKKMQGADGKTDPEKAALYSLLYGVVEPKFTEDDLVWLKQKSMAPITRITNAFTRLSGFEQKALDEARKN
jgi:hypothetical protein